MNGNSRKNLFQVITGTVGIVSASLLLSLPASAEPNSSSRSVKVSEAPVDNLYSQSQVPEPTGGNTMERMRQGDGLNNNRNTGTQPSQNDRDTGTSNTPNSTTNDTGTLETPNNINNQNQPNQGGSNNNRQNSQYNTPSGTQQNQYNTPSGTQQNQYNTPSGTQQNQYNTPSGTQQNLDNDNSTGGSNTNGGVRALW
jgi:hypothetical protein